MDDAGIQAPVASEDAAGAAPAQPHRLSWGELMTRAPTSTRVGIVLLGMAIFSFPPRSRSS